jgi:hypothetical protein
MQKLIFNSAQIQIGFIKTSSSALNDNDSSVIKKV